ncbi:MAG TPA: hypothetical protein VFF65_13235, partial [Phycisphaerales bacterium]|nr:hypothetical protein [Phycisphaerales bacterium]
EPAPAAASAPVARPKTGPDDDVLARLSEQPAPAAPPPPAPKAGKEPPVLDRGLLDSLSGDDKQ